MEQEIGYCTTPDGVRIAYATYGNDAAPPLVHLCDVPNMQEAIWDSPWGRAFFESLAGVRRLVTLDARGHGASQRDVPVGSPEAWAIDVLAVADHLHLERFDLFSGGSDSEAVALILATTHQSRISRLILWEPAAVQTGAPPGMIESLRASWPLFARTVASFVFPSGPPEVQRWYTRAMRAVTRPETATEIANWRFDLRPALGEIRVPVLIFHRKRTQLVTNDRVREVASLIPNARLVTLDGDAGAPYWDHEQFIDIVYEFLGVPSTAKASAPSGMVVILFADIADSTGLTERLGDQAFRERARSLDAELRESISVHGGTPVEGKLLGDGVLATFASAAEAIECALRCVHDGNDAELPLHLGIHAGDVIREAGNVFGGAVNITSRISEASAAGEVLVSDVVRGLARTSAGVMFEDRGEFVLKGIGEPLRLFAVRAGSG